MNSMDKENTWSLGRRLQRSIIIGKAAAANIGVLLRQSVGRVDEWKGSTHLSWPVSQSVEYVNRVFEDYLTYSGLRREGLHGLEVLELGPGDNLGVALRFIAAGAKRVVALDKFHSRRDVKKERDIYLALRNQLSPDEKDRFDSAVNLDTGLSFNAEKLSYVYGTSIESLPEAFRPSSFDLIVSRAVLMEVQDLDSAFHSMDRVLRPNGQLIHKIAPLHDYKMFSGHGFHPLEFLTISDAVYRLISSHAGAPNRQLVSAYRDKIRALQANGAVHITTTLGCTNGKEFPPGVEIPQVGIHFSSEMLASMKQVRSRLIPRFKTASDEDLMTESFFLVMGKAG